MDPVGSPNITTSLFVTIIDQFNRYGYNNVITYNPPTSFIHANGPFHQKKKSVVYKYILYTYSYLLPGFKLINRKKNDLFS